MDRSYYVYEHREADTGRTFYVGKGNRKRAWRLDSRNAHWKSVVIRHGFTVALIHESLTAEDASTLEIALIAAYGLDNLCNATEGGGGSHGFTHSAETKARMGDAKKGKHRPPMTESAREKMRVAATGRKMSDESIAKMKASKKGWRMSPEQREKAIAVLRSASPFDRTPEMRAKMAASARARGRVITLAHPKHGTVSEKATVFLDKYGLGGDSISKLFSGKALSAKGWVLPMDCASFQTGNALLRGVPWHISVKVLPRQL